MRSMSPGIARTAHTLGGSCTARRSLFPVHAYGRTHSVTRVPICRQFVSRGGRFELASARLVPKLTQDYCLAVAQPLPTIANLSAAIGQGLRSVCGPIALGCGPFAVTETAEQPRTWTSHPRKVQRLRGSSPIFADLHGCAWARSTTTRRNRRHDDQYPCTGSRSDPERRHRCRPRDLRGPGPCPPPGPRPPTLAACRDGRARCRGRDGAGHPALRRARGS
jgi:hypothetical protein